MTKHPKKARDRQKEDAQLNLNLSTGQLGEQAKPQQHRARGRGSQATWEKPSVNWADRGLRHANTRKTRPSGVGSRHSKSLAPLAWNPWNTLIPKQEILLGKAHLSLNNPLWNDNENMPKMRRPYTSPKQKSKILLNTVPGTKTKLDLAKTKTTETNTCV